jgi:hypothetical protein
MMRELEEFVQRLRALHPSKDEDALADQLRELVEPIEGVEGAEAVVPEVLAFFERFPDADLGMPGPLVHFVERCYPRYLDPLVSSLGRRPTMYTLWMVNRVLNAPLPQEQRQALLRALHVAANHPDADAATRETARGFAAHQATDGA